MMMQENNFLILKINLPKNKLSMAPINHFIDKTICCMNKNEQDFGFEKMVISLIEFCYFCQRSVETQLIHDQGLDQQKFDIRVYFEAFQVTFQNHPLTVNTADCHGRQQHSNNQCYKFLQSWSFPYLLVCQSPNPFTKQSFPNSQSYLVVVGLIPQIMIVRCFFERVIVFEDRLFEGGVGMMDIREGLFRLLIVLFRFIYLLLIFIVVFILCNYFYFLSFLLQNILFTTFQLLYFIYLFFISFQLFAYLTHRFTTFLISIMTNPSDFIIYDFYWDSQNDQYIILSSWISFSLFLYHLCMK